MARHRSSLLPEGLCPRIRDVVEHWKSRGMCRTKQNRDHHLEVGLAQLKQGYLLAETSVVQLSWDLQEARRQEKDSFDSMDLLVVPLKSYFLRYGRTMPVR